MRTFASLPFGRLFIALLLMLVPALASEVKAEDARVRGTIRAVDVNNQTVAIQPERGAAVVLNTNERTAITRNGEPARLSDLQVGDSAEAGYNARTLLASQIAARGVDVPRTARIEGVIEAVDTGASTITIFPRSGEALTLHVSPNTEITLDGRPARLDELMRGFLVGAFYQTQTLEALRIAAEGLAEVRGVVRDVGVTQGTLTIAVDDRVITLFVAPYTTLSLNGRPATLADLARGYLVAASYFPSSLVAARIAADSLVEIAGHIRAIEGTVVTIMPLVEGNPVQLFISHNTEITINGRPATYDQLRVGMAVRATYNIASLVATRIAAEGGDEECNLTSIAGTIVRIGDGNLAIALAEVSVTVNLSVTERTEITLNGEPARLSDLRVGMRVEARFCRNTLTATVIAAQS